MWRLQPWLVPILGLFAGLVGAKATAQDAAGDLALLAPVVVNGSRLPVSRLLIQGSVYWVPRSALLASGLTESSLNAARKRTVAGIDYVDARQVSGFELADLDEAELVLILRYASNQFSPRLIDLSPAVGRVSSASYLNSAYINYSITAASQGPASLAMEGVISASGHLFVTRFGRNTQGGWHGGPTTLTLNDEPGLRRWTIGDGLWNGTGLVASVPFRGLGVQSQFSFDSQYSAGPIQSIRGTASGPSVVELLLNGAVVAQRNVAAGPFEIASIPTVSGLNQLQARVKDAFGRETVINAPSRYGGAALLRPQAFTYEAAVGWRTTAKADAAPSLQDAVVAVQLATGLTDQLTIGAAAQVQAHSAAFSALARGVGAWGEAQVEAATSRKNAETGLALSLSYRLSFPTVSAGFGFARRSLPYLRWATESLDGSTRDLDFYAAWRTSNTSELSMRLSEQKLVQTGTNRRYAVAWTQRLGRALTITTQAGINTASGGLGSTSAGFGVTQDRFVSVQASYMATGSDILAASVSHDSTGIRWSGEWAQLPNEGQQLRTRVRTTGGPNQPFTRSASLAKEFRHMALALDASGQRAVGSMGAVSAGSFRASGAIIAIDNEIWASPPVQDALILVRVPDQAQLPVLLQRRLVGNTNAQGNLLISTAQSYGQNRVSVDTASAPVETDLNETEAILVPPLRGAAMIKFESSSYRVVVGQVVHHQGLSLAGAVITTADGKESSVGSDGAFAVEGLTSAAPWTVRLGKIECKVAGLPALKAGVSRVGKLKCQ